MIEIACNAENLERRPSPYRKEGTTTNIRSKVKKFIPKFLLAIRNNAKSANADMNFIN